jgi:large repetitive protein
MKPWRKSFGIWVRDRSLTDNRGFISPGVIGAVAGARRRSGGGYLAAVLADSPASVWRMNDTSGTTLTDYQGLQNGLLSGTYTLDQSGATSDGDKSILFSSGYATMADQSAWDTLSGTVDAWFLSSTTGSYQTIVRRDGSAGRSFLLRITDSNKLQGLLIFGGFPSVTSSASVTDGNWHHGAIVWTQSGGNTSLEVFLDGSSVGTASANENAPSTSQNMSIAAYSGNDVDFSEYMSGKIDDVAFYTTALSSTRISAHYNAR